MRRERDARPHRVPAVLLPRLLASLPLLLLLPTVAHAEDYTVRFTVQLDELRQGSFAVTVREKKAPLAAARFKEMVNSGFFDGCSFFRVLTGYVVQFGLSGNTTRQHEWDARGPLRDEVKISEPDWNMRGTIAFYTTGTNSRATQVFINYDDNHPLDAKGQGLAPVPFGRVVSGMNTLSNVYSGYRERPMPHAIRARGDAYLKAEFPKLSRIVRAQQVAFVEEPFALSKNTTGLLITLVMVLVMGVGCTVLRRLSKRALEGYKTTAPEEDFRPRDDEEEEGEEEEPREPRG